LGCSKTKPVDPGDEYSMTPGEENPRIGVVVEET
jgi:hypothetical protein